MVFSRAPMTQTEATTVTATAAHRANLAPCVGPWELLAPIGEGTLSAVYQAQPCGAPDSQAAGYALKTLLPQWQDDPRAIAFLRREVLVGRSVRHPHLISVLTSSVRRPPYYVVMPLLRGASLSAHLAERRLPMGLAFWFVRQIAQGLQALHEAGWTHGDVKPSNVFISPEGHATLLDLGFARRIDRHDPPLARCVIGTCNYFPPEVTVEGATVDVRSDLYSLGVVLFEMLAGRLPFEATDPAEVLRKHREERMPELHPLTPEVPKEAEALVRELLAKQPLRRPPNAREVVERLISLEIATLAQRL
jgi:serine/threonine protein kinase